MKAGGIGGFEVQPVYPLALDDPSKGFRNLPFLSEEFSGHLRYTAETARKLGLRFDLTLGSGWPFGGPEVGVTQAAGRMKRVVVSKPPFVTPDIGNGEKLVAAFAQTADGKLSGFTPPSVPAGTTAVQYYIASRTGQMVKRAVIGRRRVRAGPLRPRGAGQLSGADGVAADGWGGGSEAEGDLLRQPGGIRVRLDRRSAGGVQAAQGVRPDSAAAEAELVRMQARRRGGSGTTGG